MPLPRCLHLSANAATTLVLRTPPCRRCCHATCRCRAAAELKPPPQPLPLQIHPRRESAITTTKLKESCRRHCASALLPITLPPSCRHRAADATATNTTLTPPLPCQCCWRAARRRGAAAALPPPLCGRRHCAAATSTALQMPLLYRPPSPSHCQAVSATLPTPPPRCRRQHGAADAVAALLAAAKLKESYRCQCASALLPITLPLSCRHHQTLVASYHSIALRQRNVKQSCFMIM